VKLHTVRLELRPGRPDAWPMRQIQDWDPLRGFVPPFEQLDVARERLSMCVDLLPVAPRELVPLRHRILSAVRRREMRDNLVTINGVSDWVMPAENIERQVERSALLAKGGALRPLLPGPDPDQCHFAQPRARSRAGRAHVRGLGAVQRPELHASVGLPLLGWWFLGSNAPWRRSWFDLRERTGCTAAADCSPLASWPGC